jgi:hypothetical protein
MARSARPAKSLLCDNDYDWQVQTFSPRDSLTNVKANLERLGANESARANERKNIVTLLCYRHGLAAGRVEALHA